VTIIPNRTAASAVNRPPVRSRRPWAAMAEAWYRARAPRSGTLAARWARKSCTRRSSPRPPARRSCGRRPRAACGNSSPRAGTRWRASRPGRTRSGSDSNERAPTAPCLPFGPSPSLPRRGWVGAARGDASVARAAGAGLPADAVGLPVDGAGLPADAVGLPVEREGLPAGASRRPAASPSRPAPRAGPRGARWPPGMPRPGRGSSPPHRAGRSAGSRSAAPRMRSPRER
jgi:hypothetical protein